MPDLSADINIDSLPRVLIVDISANFGGANARVLELMKGFPKNKIGLATLNNSSIAVELEHNGYVVHRLASRKFDFRIPWRMVRIIRDNKYDLLDTQNPQSKMWGSIAALLSGVKLVSTLNSWYMNEHPKFSVRWFVYSILEFITNFKLSRYIVVSKQIQNDMVKIGISVKKIDLVYNAVNIDSEIIKDSRWDLLHKYSLPEDAVLCLAAGRLVWAKAHDDLITAISKVRSKNPRIYCLIAGEGELYESLKQQIAELGLMSNVILLGNLDHKSLLSCLKSCDIYVMPSRSEGTPIALLEAAALGKPIIASCVGGIPELVHAGVHALLVSPGDIDELSAKLLLMSEDRNMSQLLGEQAKRRVEAEFNLVRQTRETAACYLRAMQF